MKLFSGNYKLKSGYELHIHCSNPNRHTYNSLKCNGNASVTVLKPGTKRCARQALYNKNDIVMATRTTGWRGVVNVSDSIIYEFGGLDTK